MIIKDKNKLNSGTQSKILVLGLILIILVGLFSPMAQVNAVELDPNTGDPLPFQTPEPAAPASPAGGTAPVAPTGPPIAPKEGQKTETVPSDYGGCAWDFWNHIDDCILTGGYYIFFTIPALLLYVTAKFFDFMMVLSISNTATGLSGFVSAAWAVVRDFSNIFFILALLYVAIQTILGIGHETKKIIVHVIIMALLINFSLFFTKVVIDSSNILALVFYNKLEVNRSRPNDDVSTIIREKDISGEIYARFNPTTVLLDGTLFTQINKETGQPPGAAAVFGYKMGMMLIAFVVMMAAIWVFIVSAFMFLGRLVELWVLMIFSPFAFMSWTIPKFAGVEYLGWDAWFKRLIATSFMAPIYMFFLYLIFKLWGDPSVFSSLIKSNGGFWATILGVLIPAGIIIVLLMKAVDIAKKGGGKFGETASVIGKLVAGLAIGAATGGTAALAAKGLQGTVGRAALGFAKSTKLAGWETNESSAFKRFVGGKMRTIAGSADGKGGLAGSTFDIRKGVLSGALGTVSKLTGVSMGMGSKGGFLSTEEGGYPADLEIRHAKRDKRNEGLKNVVKADAEKDLNKAKIAHRELTSEASHAIGLLDKKIEDLGKKRGQGIKGSDEDKEIVKDIKALVQQKADIKGIKGENYDALASLAETAKTNAENAARTGAANAEELKKIAEAAQMSARIAKISKDSAGGKSIKDYEDKILPELEHDVDKAVRGIEKRFISNLEKQWMPPWRKAERQASVEKLRLGIKEKKSEHGKEHSDIGVLGHLATEFVGEKLFEPKGHEPKK